MQVPDPTFVQQVAESLRDFALDYFWQWITGLLVAGVVTIRAYLQGAAGPRLYLPLGAVLGIGGVVVTTAIAVWSRPAFYGALAVFGIVATSYGAVRVYRREQARLQGHPKGLLDYKKDLTVAVRDNLRNMTALTKITADIGSESVVLTGKLQKAQTENAQEAVLNRAARSYRRAAIQYRRRAEAAQRSHSDFAIAVTGIVAWHESTGGQAQLLENRPAIEVYRDAVTSARGNVSGFRNSVSTMPSISQQMNASRAELVESINISLSMMDAAVAWSEEMLGRLPTQAAEG